MAPPERAVQGILPGDGNPLQWLPVMAGSQWPKVLTPKPLVLRLCHLHNSRRFLAPNGWVNSPPRVTKITVLDKSTTDRLTVERTFFHLGRGLRTLSRDFDLRTQRGHGLPEGVTLGRRERRPRIP